MLWGEGGCHLRVLKGGGGSRKGESVRNLVKEASQRCYVVSSFEDAKGQSRDTEAPLGAKVGQESD